jgi:hypothetical protein
MTRKTIHFILLASLTLLMSGVQAQIQFADSSHLLSYPNLKSGVAMAVTDMNGDGYDDLIRFSDADTLIIEYQHADGSFEQLNLGYLTFGDEWSVCAADVDRNGYIDILTGGNVNHIKLLNANTIGTGFSTTIFPSTGPFPIDTLRIYMQASNLADINNDGAIDYFACNDVGINSVYRNDGTGAFIYDTSLIDTRSVLPEGSEVQPDSEDSGNYGSTWTDYDWDGDIDLYISKCRAGVTDSADGRRVNLLLQNDGSGNYTEVGLTAGLRPYAQSWSSAFGDLDNDGDMDCFVINHEPSSQFFWNNGNGTFTDVTSSTGVEGDLSTLGGGIQVIMEDFDNDGLLDVYITTDNGNNLMFHNNGDTTFTDIDVVTIMGGSGAQSAAAGDLNHDGFVDLITGFAFGFNEPSPIDKYDKLLLNTGNSNHFINISLTGVESNINGIGSRIEIYGAFGKQIREVRAGDSYGIQNSLSRHFGLGTNTLIDSMIIRWPSGNVDKHLNIAADQFLKFREGCVGPKSSYTVSNMDDDGPGSLRALLSDACTGDTLIIDITISTDTMELSSPLLIDKSIVIKGQGSTQTFFSGAGLHRIFQILPGNEVWLSDMAIIESGGVGIQGGAIYNAGNLHLTNISMRENLKDGLPRAIENVGKLTIEGGLISVEE